MSQQTDVGEALNSRQIARTASLIMVALGLSGILGLARQVILSATFGAGRDLDAFYAALRVPETLFVLVAGGALGSAFIPVFSRYLAKDDFEGAWRLASAVLTWMVGGGVVLSLIFFIFADPVVKTILVPSAAPDSQALTAELMRMMLVTVVIFGVSGLIMGILNSHQSFLLPALSPSAYNVGLIFGAAVLSPSMGVHGLAWGAVIGSGLHLAIQVPSLLRLPYIRLEPTLAWSQAGVGEVLSLMAPRVLGLGVVQVNFWVNAALTSGMVVGSLSALQTAFALMFTLLGILGQSMGTAVFPTLSRLHAEGNTKAFGETLLSALGNVLFLSIPASLGLAVLSHPLIAVLFERGEWTSRDTGGTAWALALFGIGLAGHAVLEILARAFYALHDTWTPVQVGGLTMLLNIVLSLIFLQLWGEDASFERGAFGGLALSMSISTALESTTLWIILRRRIQLSDRMILKKAGLTLLAALGMAVLVAGWQILGENWSPLILLVGGMVLGVGSFWGLALLFRLEEARHVPRLIFSRLGSRRGI